MRLMQQQPATDQPAYHIFNCGFSKWGAKVRISLVCKLQSAWLQSGCNSRLGWGLCRKPPCPKLWVAAA